MSTAAEPSPAAGPQYLEFDQYVDFQLQKTRSGIRTADLLTAGVVSALIVLGYLFTFTVLDHWVIPGGFGFWTRLSLLVLLLAGLTTLLVWKVVLPARRRVAALYAARELERATPGLRSNLLTLVDLQRAGRPIAPQVLTTLQKRAAKTLAESNVDEAIDRRPLLWTSYALCGLLAVMFAYVVLSPKRMSASIWRALWPSASVAAATRTVIRDVTPGHATVLRGDQLEVQVDLAGEIPPEIRLLFTTDDARFVDEAVALRPVDDRLHRFRGVLTGERGRGLLQGLSYHIVAGDAESPPYRVTVEQPPSATVSEVSYRFPNYMRFSPRTDMGGTIDAWEGTLVTVRAVANMPVASATIQYSDAEDWAVKAEEFPMTVRDGTRLEGTVRLQFRTDGSKPNFYRVQVRTEANATDPRPVALPLRIREDLPPKLTLHHPTGDEQVAANAIVPLAFRARDPDFLLHSLTLFYRQPGDEHARQFPLVDAPLNEQAYEATYRLPLPTLNLPLQPGGVIEYWLEARDNLEPFPGRQPNITRSAAQRFEIIEPAAPQQVNEQFAAQEQQAQQRLDETRAAETEGAESATGAAADEPSPAEGDDPMRPESESATGENGSTGEQRGNSTGDSANDSRQPGNSSERPGDAAAGTDPSSAQPMTGDAPQPMPGENPGESTSDSRQPGGTGESSAQSSSQGGPGGERGTPTSSQPGGNSAQQRGPEQSPATGDTESTSNGSPSSAGPATASPSHSGQSPGGEQAGASPQRGTQSPQNQRGATDNSTSGSDQASDDRILRELVERSRQQSPPDGSHAGANGQDLKPPSGAAPVSAPPHGDGPTNESRGESAPGATGGESSPIPEANKSTSNTGATPTSPGDTTGSDSGMPPTATSDGNTRGQTRPGETAPADQQQPTPREATGDTNSQQPGTPAAGSPQAAPPADARPMSGTEPDTERPQPGNTRDGNPPPGATPQPGAAPDNGTPDATQPGRETPPQGTNPPGEPARPTLQEQPASADRPGDAPSDGAGAASPNGTASDSGAAGAGQQQPGGQQGGGQQGGGQQGGGQQGGGQQGGGQQGGGQQGGGQQGGGQQGGGQQGGGQQGGGQQGGGQQGGGQQGGGQQGGGNPGGQGGGQPGGQGGGRSGSGAAGGAPGGQGGVGGGGNTPDGGGSGAALPTGNVMAQEVAERNLEDERRAANLALRQLQDQLARGEVDEELKRQLGVNDADLQAFLQRMQQQLDADSAVDTPEARARQRQFEEVLRGIQYDATGGTREAGEQPGEAARGSGGVRRPTPPEYRDQERAFREQQLKPRR